MPARNPPARSRPNRRERDEFRQSRRTARGRRQGQIRPRRMAPVGSVHPRPARAEPPPCWQPARARRGNGGKERPRCLYPPQRGGVDLGGGKPPHHRHRPGRERSAVRAFGKQDLPPPDLFRHSRRRGAHVMAEPDKDALFQFLLRIGDNTLILGHRVSEWCGHSPVLEEDIALANTALDMIGQTQMWLGYAAEVQGDGKTADDLAFLRDAWDFRNVLLVELPNGDFGQTLMRQFLYDAWASLLLPRLAQSADPRVAEIAEKAAKEVAYHIERSADTVVGLGDG